MKKVIAATGLDGLIGAQIKEVLRDEFEFINLREGVIDITDESNVSHVIESIEFDTFLHLAAYTNVDQAENEPEKAWKINVTGTKNVFDAVSKKYKNFIYMSTGFVFDGEHPPYFEDSQTNPISQYGVTKLEGEKVISGKAAVIRIDYPYGGHVSYKSDIVESIAKSLKEKKEISGVSDQILTPTYIEDIALSVRHVINNFDPRVYHIVGSDSLTGFDIIKTIGEVFEFDTSHVRQVSHEQFYQGKAPRPKKSIMKTKVNNFHMMRNFRDGLERLKSLRYYKDL